MHHVIEVIAVQLAGAVDHSLLLAAKADVLGPGIHIAGVVKQHAAHVLPPQRES